MERMLGKSLLWSVLLVIAQLLGGPLFTQRASAACPPVQAPDALSPSGTIGAARPTFQWTRVSGAQTYTLYVLRVSDEAVILRQTGLTGTSFKPPRKLPSNVQMRWKVKSESACGPGPYSPSTFFTVSAGGPPCPPTTSPVPTRPSGTISDSTPTFAWKAAPVDFASELFCLVSAALDLTATTPA